MCKQRIRLDLSDLAWAVEGDLGGVSEDGRTVIATILGEHPSFADQLAKLDEMARDAGVDNVLDGFETHRRFEILMSEEWEHPADVLEEGRRDIWYDHLLHLAQALAERSEDPSRIVSVRERLESAYAIHRLGEEIFESSAERLGSPRTRGR